MLRLCYMDFLSIVFFLYFLIDEILNILVFYSLVEIYFICDV